MLKTLTVLSKNLASKQASFFALHYRKKQLESSKKRKNINKNIHLNQAKVLSFSQLNKQKQPSNTHTLYTPKAR